MSFSNLRILSVEDEPIFQANVKQNIAPTNEVVFANTLDEARAALATGRFDVILLDKKLGTEDGTTLIAEIRRAHLDTAIIILTSDTDLDAMQKALNDGATDYLIKGRFPLPQLSLRVPIAIKKAKLEHKNAALVEQLTRTSARKMLGSSPAMLRLRCGILALKGRNSNILITGETGTGKDLVAQQIHEIEGDPARPYFQINCGAISPNLIESELFGHIRGAFTGADRDKRGLFELAHEGDLFLDEIGDLPSEVQVKLLRVLEEHAVTPVGTHTKRPANVRIITATNKDLEEEVKAGRFREDLLYRLNVINIQTPPLRDRATDIPILTDHFLNELSKGKYCIADDARAYLAQQSWPGNIRDLRHTIDRAIHRMIMRGGDGVIQKLDLIRSKAGFSARGVDATCQVVMNLPKTRNELSNVTYSKFMRDSERHFLERAIKACGGNIIEAAERIGVSKTTLYRRMEYIGIPYEKRKQDKSVDRTTSLPHDPTRTVHKEALC
jgi:DNA-binding NtrC family response regulator